jgi:hypothetical protein
MDSIVACACLAVAGAVGLAWLTGFARGVQGQVEGFGALLGGWQGPKWPRGIQEDDPESSWADRHGLPPAPPYPDRRPDPAPARFEADDTGDRFASWIEELD